MGLLLPPSSSMAAAVIFYPTLFALAASADRLSFIRPGQPLDSTVGLPHYSYGQRVNVTWTTGFAHTTLKVVRETQEGPHTEFVSEVLAHGYPRDRTTYEWTASDALTKDHDASSYYFELQNARDANCKGCSLDSTKFRFSKNPQSSLTSSSSSSSSSSAHAAKTRSKTSTDAKTTNTAAGAAKATPDPASASPTHKSSGSGDNLGVSLGVGLGVGIPVVLALLGLFFFFLRRMERSKKNKAKYQQPEEEEEMRRTSVGRASSAVDPAFHPSSPTYAGAAGPPPASRHSHARSQGSWIEPFDFERPEMREHDAMSQLRQSIYSSRADGRSSRGGRDSEDHSLIGTDLSSLAGLPPVPQSVHRNSGGR